MQVDGLADAAKVAAKVMAKVVAVAVRKILLPAVSAEGSVLVRRSPWSQQMFLRVWNMCKLVKLLKSHLAHQIK